MVEHLDGEAYDTAVCPNCGIDSVMAEHVEERVPDDLLRAMNQSFF